VTRRKSKTKFIIQCVAFWCVMLFAADAFAASCPHCGQYYPPAAPGDQARVNALRRAHERQHGGSRGGSSRGYSQQQFAVDAFGSMLNGFMQGLEQGRRNAAARAAAQAAERRRRAALERARLERLRKKRIRQAARFRVDLDRREAEMRERLAGVFDVVGGPVRGADDFDESDVYVDSSVVDLRPERGERHQAEARARLMSGRINPDFFASAQRRAAETDAFATENYGSMGAAGIRGPEKKQSIIEPVKGLAKMMAKDAVGKAIGALGPAGATINRARAIHGASEELGRETLGNLSSAADAVAYEPGRIDAVAAKYERAPLKFWEGASGDEHASRRAYMKQFSKIGGAVKSRTRGLLTGSGS
jgi:hypothetical protein